MPTEPTSYDVVAYPSCTHAQTHPDRMAVIGTLLGLSPAGVQRCRVLELGCGNGNNLVPMASGFPESEFVGIDLAAQPIIWGQGMIRELGLANVRLVQGDLMEIGKDWGRFDYIIAHGLYSWVPEAVRERLLALCRECLAPQGIAFVSYNAFPGGHLNQMVREMMLFHVRGFKAPEERVAQAQALVRFLSEALDTSDEYRLWLKAELKLILGHEEGHLYHDELAEINQPVYFTQFVEKAGAHGLQYLAEADYFELFDYGFKESARQIVERLGSNRILREQYLDFLKCRRFRQTLLCHAGLTLNPQPPPAAVTRFYVSSSARRQPAAADNPAGKAGVFVTPKGARCATDFELGQAALAELQKVYPMPLPFDEVVSKALAGLKPGLAPGGAGVAAPDRDQLAAFFLELFSAGVVEFRSQLPRVSHLVSERPVASPVARWQIRQGHVVTSQLHLAVKVEDEIGKHLVSRLDGTRDHRELAEEIWQLLKSKNALVVPDGDEAAARKKVEAELEDNLQKLARLGLLVG